MHFYIYTKHTRYIEIQIQGQNNLPQLISYGLQARGFINSDNSTLFGLGGHKQYVTVFDQFHLTEN